MTSQAYSTPYSTCARSPDADSPTNRWTIAGATARCPILQRSVGELSSRLLDEVLCPHLTRGAWVFSIQFCHPHCMAINNWWDSQPDEIYWMEIRTDREGLGEYLRAPKVAANGRPSPFYELTSFVQPGDRILHWHDTGLGETGIVGWSEAVGPLQTMTWSWQARGTRGRERGVPTVGPTWNLPLGGLTRLEQPLTRSSLNVRREEIFEILEEVGAVSGSPIYAPFQNYGGRELRAQQGYLTKFPAALVAYLFAVPSVAGAQVTPSSSAAVRKGGGQGYLSDAEKRGAIERYAVAKAIAYYREEGATEIEELGKPYDLRVVIGGVERHVEVKGSIGDSVAAVQLTQGEVDHAERYQPTDLFVVDGVVATRTQDGGIETSGGNVRLWGDWRPDRGALRPTHLRYTLPG